MKGNLSGYHDSLIASVIHYESDPTVIEVGDPVAITEVAFVEDSSIRNLVALPGTTGPLGNTVMAHADWLPFVEDAIGEVDTLHIGFPLHDIPNAQPLVETYGAPIPRLYAGYGHDTAGARSDFPAVAPCLICGEGYVQLGVDTVAIGDELYLLPGGGAVPGSAGDNVASVTNVAADRYRQIAIELEAGDTNDIIRAFIFPFPRDSIEPQ